MTTAATVGLAILAGSTVIGLLVAYVTSEARQHRTIRESDVALMIMHGWTFDGRDPNVIYDTHGRRWIVTEDDLY